MILVVCTHYVCNNHYLFLYIQNNRSSKKQIRDTLKLLYHFLCDTKKKKDWEREGAKNQDVQRMMHLAVLSNMYRDCY